jgi:serine/threonine protein kinase
MENGDIARYLKNNPAGINRLSLVNTLLISGCIRLVHHLSQVLDIALGLDHLHCLKVVHGDLKAVRPFDFSRE